MAQDNSEKSRIDAEVDSIVAEMQDLHREGNLNDAAIARLDALIEKDIQRSMAEADERIARLKASFDQPKKRWYRVPLLAVWLFILIGLVLEFTIGRCFVFAEANNYRLAHPVLFFSALPFAALFGFFAIRQQEYRYPTWAVRWLILFPVFSILTSEMVVYSPLGWAALSGWVVGTRSDRLEAKVLAVGPLRSNSQGCDQDITLEMIGNSAEICLKWRLKGTVPKPGDTVSITGLASALGVYIEEIRPK